MFSITNYELVEIEPEELKPHPVNAAIYGEIEVDQTLVDSIREKGQLEPIIINKDNVIISGCRRWLAIKKINAEQIPQIEVDDVTDTESVGEHIHLKAKCQRIDFTNEVEEKKAIIEYNRRREKRYSQLYNEIEALREIYDPMTEVKRRKNLTILNVTTLSRRIDEAVKRGDIDSQVIDPSLTPTEKAREYGYLVGGPGSDIIFEDFMDTHPYPSPGSEKYERTRKKIAKALGIGIRAVDKITYVGRLAKEQKDDDAIKAMRQLDSADKKKKITLNKAYTVCRLKKEYINGVLDLGKKESNPTVVRLAQNLLEEIDHGDKSASKAWQEFKIRKTATEDNTYDIVLIEPDIRSTVDLLNPDLQRLRSMWIPAPFNAALFVIANVNTLRFCIELISRWNFHLQSFTPITVGDTRHGEWSSSGYDILLLAKRGCWPTPLPEDRFSGDVINRDELHDIIQKMYPGIESFYEIDVEKQHAGWGQPREFIPESIPEPEVEKDYNHEAETHQPSPVETGGW